MAKASTFDSRITGPAMRAMRHIPVDRAHGASASRRAGRGLAGGVVGIFPEATISRSWTLKSFKLGAATLTVEPAAEPTAAPGVAIHAQRESRSPHVPCPDQLVALALTATPDH